MNRVGTSPATRALACVLAVLVFVGAAAPSLSNSGTPTSTPTPNPTTRLADFFPRTINGKNGIFLQYRNQSGTYTNLANAGDYWFNTPGMPWNIPYVRFTNGRIYATSAAVIQVGAKRDVIIRVTLSGNENQVRVWGYAGKDGGSMRFYIYKGENNYNTSIWEMWDGGTFDLNIPYSDGEQLFFAVDAGPDEINDWSFWQDINFVYIPTPTTTPTPTPTTPVTTIINKSCSNGDTLEKTETMSKASNPCWGWVRTHTYLLDQPYFVSIINGRINMGMSELGRMVPVEIQISSDGVNFRTILSTEAMADPSTMTPFSVIVNDNLKAVRLYSKDNYLDHSTISVYTTTTSVSTTPVPTTPTPKPASTPLQTPANRQNPNPTKIPLTTENPVTQTPSKSETNWTLLGGALFAILLIGTVILRSRKSKGNTNQASTELLIKRGYSVHPNNDIKFGIRLDNNTNLVIIDTDVILDYNKNLFSTLNSDLQHVGNIMPNSARTATYLLKPLGCIHNEQINALITCKDHTGKKQTIHMRPKEVHCVCPFLKEKPMSEGEYSRLAASSEIVQEGISFKGITVEDLTKFMDETCRHILHKVREYDIEGKKVIYLSGESVGEKAYYLLTAVIQEYKGLTQIVLRAHSDKEYGLNGFMNEMADSLRHLVGSVQNAKEIGIIENTQVINIIDSVVQRTSFNMGEGGNSKVNIKDSVVQRSKIGKE